MVGKKYDAIFISSNFFRLLRFAGVTLTDEFSDSHAERHLYSFVARHGQIRRRIEAARAFLGVADFSMTWNGGGRSFYDCDNLPVAKCVLGVGRQNKVSPPMFVKQCLSHHQSVVYIMMWYLDVLRTPFLNLWIWDQRPTWWKLSR
jgi:hypothetical protein